MNRFTAHLSATGDLFVLDTFSGQVVKVGSAGAPLVVCPPWAAMGPGHQPLPLPVSGADSSPSPVGAEAAKEGGATWTSLDHEVVASYPYPIARAWQDFLNEDDPKAKCRIMVDCCFTNILKMWALQLASEYLRAEQVRDPTVNQTLVRDLARPLISAWGLMVQRSIPVLRAAGVPLFSPELAKAYEVLEAKCRQRVEVSQPYEDEDGVLRQRKASLGKIQAVLSLRNRLAHGFNLQKSVAEEYLAKYLPVVRDILAESRFMVRYPLYHADVASRSPDGAIACTRLMGARPGGTAPEPLGNLGFDPALSPLFLRNEATGEELPLFCFLEVERPEPGRPAIPGLGGDVFLFEGNTDTSVIYVSSSGEHREKQKRIRYWRDLLRSKQIEVKTLSSDNLSAASLQTAAARVTDAAIERLVQSGKFIQELSAPREDFDERLMQFDAGDYRGLLIGGESGIGKTTLLARQVQLWREAGDVAILYRASGLREPDLAAALMRDLGLGKLYFEQFLQAADPVFKAAPTPVRFRVVVDALNEFPADVGALCRSVDALVAQAQDYPWFKLVASIRTSSWERLGREHRPGAIDGARWLRIAQTIGARTVQSALVPMQPLPASRIGGLYELYRAYRRRDSDDPEDKGVHLFRPNTAFGDLDPSRSSVALMRTPLLMRLVLAAYHRRDLPSDLSSDQVMRLYVDQVILEVDHPDGQFPQRLHFLNGLVREMDRLGDDSIPRDAVLQVPALQAAMKSTQRDSPYVQLLDLGILAEEWLPGTCRLRFVYDRLFEHLLAEHHHRRVETAEDVLRLAARAVTFKGLKGAIAGVLLLACRDRRHRLIVELIDLCDRALDEDQPAVEVATEVIRELLELLGRGRDPAFGDLLAMMPSPPSRRDVLILTRASANLLLGGEPEGAAAAAAVALAEARILAGPDLLAQALRCSAQLEESAGNLKAALALLAEASAVDPDELSRLRSDLRRTRILDAMGRGDEALRLLEGLVEALRGRDDAAEAEALWLLAGSLWDRVGDFIRPGELQARALSLARKARLRWLESKVMASMHELAEANGNVEEARRHVAEALAIAEGDGLPAAIADSCLLFGNFLAGHGEVEQAGQLLARALRIHERLGQKVGVAAVMRAQAAVSFRGGRHEEAEGLVNGAIALSGPIGDVKGLAAAKLQLAGFARARGAFAAASAILEEVLALRRTHSDTAGEAEALRSLADVLREQRLYARTEEVLMSALDLERQRGNRRNEAVTLNRLGNLCSRQKDSSRCISHYEDARRISSEIGWRRMVGATANNLAIQFKRLGDVAKAEAYYLESNAIDESMDARSSLAIGLSNLASLYLDGGRLDEEERLRLRVLEIRRSLRDVDGEAVALGALAALHARRQRHSEAESCYRQALEVRTRIGNPGPIISASRALAHFLRQRGRMAEATRLYGDAAVLAEQLEDQDWRWFCQTDAAELALLGGDPAGAVAIWLQALEYFRSKEMHDSVCGALGSIADARERLGHHALAAEALREVVGARRARGAKAAIASAHLALGGHLRLVGRFEEARVELGEALALREAIGNPDKVARAELALARLELRELRLDDAQPRIERALGIFTRLGDPDDLILIRTLSAQLLRARGEDEESDALWDSVLRDARGIGCPVQLANSLSERGADLLLLGRAGDALAALDEAAALAERAGRTSLRCHLDLLAANALLDLGDVPRTAPLVARARETADRSGEARHRSMLAALGLRIALRERDAGAIAAAEQAARESAAGIPAAADAMSGFATAWLDLAEWHAGSGRNAEAAALAAQALVAATWQRWHRRERARTLAGDQAR